MAWYMRMDWGCQQASSNNDNQETLIVNGYISLRLQNGICCSGEAMVLSKLIAMTSNQVCPVIQMKKLLQVQVIPNEYKEWEGMSETHSLNDIAELLVVVLNTSGLITATQLI